MIVNAVAAILKAIVYFAFWSLGVASVLSVCFILGGIPAILWTRDRKKGNAARDVTKGGSK